MIEQLISLFEVISEDMSDEGLCGHYVLFARK